jgi:23S rRNA (cytosine1962-C5)-methyltransferase
MTGLAPLPTIPSPSQRRLALRVTTPALRAIRGGHPWLFDQSITSVSGDGQPGDLAVIFDDRRKFVAIGLWDPFSPLRVRILHAGEPVAIDASWLRNRLEAAAAVRRRLQPAGTNAYRLVHGENDGLPGLVIDRYDRTFVLKLYSAGWIPWLNMLLGELAGVLPVRNVILRLSREVAGQPDRLYGLTDGTVLHGNVGNGRIPFAENRLRFEADVIKGQKTGFFLDQRDNRAGVASHARGARVLNVFAYSGGFSVYAAAGGAREVTSLDLSAPALADAQRNFSLNQHVPAVAAAQHSVLLGDAFDALGELRATRQHYDLVIVDPPAFAKRENEVPAALQAYARLTGLALGVLSEGGLLVQASCSSRVDAEVFFETVHRAARRAARPLREIERTGHAVDHPIGFPEGAYLKCLFAVA